MVGMPKERSAKLPVSGFKGMNVKIMDQRLQEMVSEADYLEAKIASLKERMQDLRRDIRNYDEVAIPENSNSRFSPASLNKVESKPVVLLPQDKQPIVLKPKPTKAKLVSAPKPTLTTSNVKGVVGLREGRHSDKTRLVFDVNGSTEHTINFDREVSILTVTLPETKWSTNQSKSYPKSSQIQGYEAKPSNGGSIIAIAVHNVESVETETLRPVSGKPARLIIDLMK